MGLSDKGRWVEAGGRVNLVDHPIDPTLWRHEPPIPGTCWVCGEETKWICLDIAYQHEDCDAYPSEEGDVRIVRGVKQ